MLLFITDYIIDCLERIEKLKVKNNEELATYTGVTRQLSSKTGIVPLTEGLLNTYDWGVTTNGIKIKVSIIVVIVNIACMVMMDSFH